VEKQGVVRAPGFGLAEQQGPDVLAVNRPAGQWRIRQEGDRGQNVDGRGWLAADGSGPDVTWP